MNVSRSLAYTQCKLIVDNKLPTLKPRLKNPCPPIMFNPFPLHIGLPRRLLKICKCFFRNYKKIIKKLILSVAQVTVLTFLWDEVLKVHFSYLVLKRSNFLNSLCFLQLWRNIRCIRFLGCKLPRFSPSCRGVLPRSTFAFVGVCARKTYRWSRKIWAGEYEICNVPEREMRCLGKNYVV